MPVWQNITDMWSILLEAFTLLDQADLEQPIRKGNSEEQTSRIIEAGARSSSKSIERHALPYAQSVTSVRA